MFNSAGKCKPLGKALREGNSKANFLAGINREQLLMNRSLDSSKMEKQPNLKQTKICVRRSLKRLDDTQTTDTFTSVDKLETKTELFLMPNPLYIKKQSYDLANTSCVEPSTSANARLEVCSSIKAEDEKPKRYMDNLNRQKLSLVGNVEFLFKAIKMYPNLNALWNIYGKLLKITPGKHRFQYILLMRNIENNGPILQCVYYVFDENKIQDLIPGNNFQEFGGSSALKIQHMSLELKNYLNLRVVGQLMDSNKLRCFKVEVLKTSVQHKSLMRIQNVNTFVILQNQTKN